MSKRTIVGLLLAAAGLLAHPGAYADIFRCVDKGGNSLFTDRPCPSGTRATDITTAVQVCGSADCLERLERDYQAAEERRRAEREQLEFLKEESRRRAEEEASLEALRAREAVVPEPVAPVEPYDPGYVVGVPLWTCVGPRCFPYPPPHHKHRHDAHARDRQPWDKDSDRRRDDAPRLGVGMRPVDGRGGS